MSRTWRSLITEPTSAVDAHTEARIAPRLVAARAGRTTVVLCTSPLLLEHDLGSGHGSHRAFHRELVISRFHRHERLTGAEESTGDEGRIHRNHPATNLRDYIDGDLCTDLAVAEEAAVTAEMLGNRVERLTDVPMRVSLESGLPLSGGFGLSGASALATAFAVGKQLKKSCVLVKDAPAFVVNRLLTRFLGEVTKAVDEGADFEVADGQSVAVCPAPTEDHTPSCWQAGEIIRARCLADGESEQACEARALEARRIPHVLVGGRRCPVRGRVCMNLIMVDVGHLPDVSVGDEVVLLARVSNAGALGVRPNVKVEFYRGDSMETGTLLGSGSTTSALLMR